MYFGFSMWNSAKERKTKGQEMTVQDKPREEFGTVTGQYDTGTGGFPNGTVATNDPWAPIPETQPVLQQPADASGQYQDYSAQDSYRGYEDTSQARGVGAGAEFPDKQDQKSGDADGAGKLWFEKPAQNDPWQSYQ